MTAREGKALLYVRDKRGVIPVLPRHLIDLADRRDLEIEFGRGRRQLPVSQL